MRRIVFLGIGAVVLGLVCGVAFWLGRASTSPAVETSVATVQPPPPPQIDVAPSLAVGSRVEALSNEGWQPATIQEVSGDQALIRYERKALGEERVDLRLLRKPEGQLIAEAPKPPPAAAPSAPPSGRASAGGAVALGTYACDLDTKGIVKGDTGTFADDEAQQWELQLTLEILSDRTYRAFGQDEDQYRYDPATGRITWESGMLSREPAEYRAGTRTIVGSMGGQALTCRLEG